VRAGHSNMRLTVRGESKCNVHMKRGIIRKEGECADASVADAEMCE